MPRRHITLRSLDTVSHFGVKDDGEGLDYFIPDKDLIKESDFPASHHAGYISYSNRSFLSHKKTTRT